MAYTFPAMRRVPLPAVLISVPAVIGVVWWQGTRDFDFLAAPSATEIETARSRATAALARPSDLFAIERTAESTEPVALTDPPPAPPKPAPKPPRIEISDPGSPAPPDAWIERDDLPAGSFIELASRLESDAHLAWARVTWERVIDLAEASREDREIAVRAVARIRASMPPPEALPDDAPTVTLAIKAPADRLELTRRAADEAARGLEQASDRSIRFVAKVESDPSEEPQLHVMLLPPSQGDEPPAAATSDAPSDPDKIRNTILSSAFRLIASALATSDGLQPPPPPLEGQPPQEALSTRITRRAWATYVAGDERNP